MHDLSKPEVVHCFFQDSFQPPLPAMVLRWDAATPVALEQTWHFPAGVRIHGPAPVQFGITVYRQGADAYQLRVLWNGLCLSWEGLTRVQIMASSLAPVLRVLGTDLWYLLTQPAAEQPPAIHAKVA